MILYHFTCEQHLDRILRDGLTRGDVPTSVTDGRNGVWFTTSPAPQGHGVFADGAVSREIRAETAKLIGRVVPEGSKYADKTAARIEVVISSHDPRLVSWAKWGRKHCEISMFSALNRTGPEWKTWFIYFGTIPADRFGSVLLNGKLGGI